MVQISSYAVAVMVLMSASYGASMPADMINDAFNQVSGCKIFPDGRKSCSLEQGSWMDGLSGCKLDLENARACCADHAGNQTCGSIDSLDDIDADELTEIDTVGSWWRKVADKCKINWAKKEVCCTFKYGRVCGGLTAANPNIDNVEIAEEFYSELSTIKDAVHEDAAIEDAAIEDADITENLGAWWVPIAKHCRIHFFKKSVCCKVGRVRVCGGLKAENPNIDDAEVAEEFYSELATFKDASVEEAQVNESLEAWWTPIAKHCTLNIFTKTACCTVKKVKVCGSLKAVNPNAEDIEDYQDMLETVALEAESTELANLEGKWWEKFKKNCTFDFAAGSVCCKTPLGKICGSLNSAENPMAEDLEYSNELEIVDDEGFTELSNLEGKWWEKFKKNCTFDFAAQSVCCKTPLGRVCGSLNSSLANPFTSQDNPFASVEDEFESFSEELFMEDGGDVTTELIEGSRYNKWFKRCKINRKTKTICCKKSEKKEKKDKKDEDEKSQLEKREKKDKKDKKEKSKKDTKCFKLKPRRRRSNPKPKPSPTPRPRPTPKPATLSMGSEETSSISALNSLMASGNVDETINVEELNEMIANLDGIELEFENGARIVSEETLEALENINAGSNYNVAYLYAALAAGILVLGAAGGLVFKKVAAKTAAKNAYSDSEDKKADLLDNYHDVADVSDAAVTV